MARHFTSLFGIVVLFTSVASARPLCEWQSTAQPAANSAPGKPGPGSPPRPKWWLEPKDRLELGITDQQSAEINRIFESTISKLREARRELDELEDALSKTIQGNTADLATVTQQIDRVESARSTYNKIRTLMLYRMNLVLSPEQREKVKAMHQQHEDARRKGGPDR